MKKFLLVVFIGMVLAINLYGIANEIYTKYFINEVEDQIANVIYVE